MVTLQGFRELALSFPDTEEKLHFHLPSFRYKNKIFATLWEKEIKAMVKLSVNDQSVYCTFDNSLFSPVNGTWGKQGATFIELQKIKKSLLKEVLAIAYSNIISKK